MTPNSGPVPVRTRPYPSIPACRSLAARRCINIERNFRTLKVDDLDLRSIPTGLTDRVRAHVLIRMLSTGTEVPMFSGATIDQRRAFQLLATRAPEATGDHDCCD